jgi:hypothetical protein
MQHFQFCRFGLSRGIIFFSVLMARPFLCNHYEEWLDKRVSEVTVVYEYFFLLEGTLLYRAPKKIQGKKMSICVVFRGKLYKSYFKTNIEF